MLKHVRNLGLRIGEFDSPNFDTKEIAASLDILHKYFGTDSSSIRPHPNEDIIRDEIRSIAPKIATLADTLIETLESSHSGIFIPKFKLDTFDVETRKFVLYALTLCMGHPSATDQVDNRIIWDIKARDELLQPNHIPTYSEHANEAELHTDTQYHPEPERYLILYFIRQANCGGGASILRDFNSIKQNMRQALREPGRLIIWRKPTYPSRSLPALHPTGARIAWKSLSPQFSVHFRVSVTGVIP